MKGKLYLSAITFVIAGLLITSVSGIKFDAQMTTDTEELEIETQSNEIETSGMYKLADIASTPAFKSKSKQRSF